MTTIPAPPGSFLAFLDAHVGAGLSGPVVLGFVVLAGVALTALLAWLDRVL